MKLLIIIFGALAVILYWSLTYKNFRHYGVWETISSSLKVKALAWIVAVVIVAIMSLWGYK